jgi:hypothetical protein
VSNAQKRKENLKNAKKALENIYQHSEVLAKTAMNDSKYTRQLTPNFNQILPRRVYPKPITTRRSKIDDYEIFEGVLENDGDDIWVIRPKIEAR